jgi:uncharacterized protein YjbI with pentapeptide repeats
MTGAILLRWIPNVAFVMEGESREVPGREECTFDASVTTPVKGALVEGQTFAVSYNGWDGCYGGSNGKPTLGQYYRNEDGRFEIPLCAFALDEDVVTAYLKQKRDLESAARGKPHDLAAQLAVARFFVGWQDDFRSAPAVAAALLLAPSDPEARLLKTRLDFLTAGYDVPKLKSAREKFDTLRNADPAARILFEVTDRRIRQESLRTADGAPAEHVELPPSTLKNIDLTGRDMTGFSLDGIMIEGLVAPRSDWTAGVLSDGNFSGVDFSEAIFTEAVLARAVFKGANLNDAKFAGALLAGADFRDASMRLANLRGADATEARFAGADLRGADLRGVGLVGADFTGARYDCTTRFRSDFAPKKAGMALDGACAGGEGPAK